MFTSKTVEFILISGFIDLVPGPAMLFIIMQSAYGIRQVLYGLAGLLVANFVWITLAATGVGLLLSQSPVAFEVLRWIGALYLAYIGVNIIRKGISKPDVSKVGDNVMGIKVFLRGMLISLSNPKALLFYIALFPNFTREEFYFNDVFYFGALKLGCISLVMLSYGFLGKKLFSYLENSKVISGVFRTFGVGIVLAAVMIVQN